MMSLSKLRLNVYLKININNNNLKRKIMAVTARSQITIVDLNDARTVQVLFTPSQGYVQGYNPDTHVYTPDYTKTNNIVTPQVFESGNAQNQIALCSNVKYTVNGAVVGGSSPNYAVDGQKRLVIKGNLETSLNVQFEADYTSRGITTHFGAAFSIIRNETSGALFSVVITPKTTTVFDQNNKTSLIATAQAYRGNTPDNTGITYKWTKFNSNGSWENVTNGVSGAQLTVQPDDVLNFQVYKCTATDNGAAGDSKVEASALITFQDMTDPYRVELFSPTGDKIVNGQGSTQVMARIWQGAEKIEDETTAAAQQKFTYKWLKFDKLGRASNWQGTTSNEKSGGNPITVNASDVSEKCTIFCEVTKK